jgi:hypothetical protein
MPAEITAKDVVAEATLGDMVIAATVVDTAVVDTIEDMVVDLGTDTDPEIDMDMDMDLETVATLGTIQATETQVTDMEVKRVGAIIVAATEVEVIVMIVIVVAAAIATHAQDMILETESTTANSKDTSIYHRVK